MGSGDIREGSLHGHTALFYSPWVHVFNYCDNDIASHTTCNWFLWLSDQTHQSDNSHGPPLDTYVLKREAAGVLVCVCVCVCVCAYMSACACGYVCVSFSMIVCVCVCGQCGWGGGQCVCVCLSLMAFQWEVAIYVNDRCMAIPLCFTVIGFMFSITVTLS